MEITKELIESLSADDVETICAYRELLAEAKADVSAIREAYRFRIGEDKIIIWKDEDNTEYLTYEGKWTACYCRQVYYVSVNVESVFAVYQEEYNHKKVNGRQRNDMADSARYFRNFASAAKRLLKEQEGEYEKTD